MNVKVVGTGFFHLCRNGGDENVEVLEPERRLGWREERLEKKRSNHWQSFGLHPSNPTTSSTDSHMSLHIVFITTVVVLLNFQVNV